MCQVVKKNHTKLGEVAFKKLQYCTRAFLFPPLCFDFVFLVFLAAATVFLFLTFSRKFANITTVAEQSILRRYDYGASVLLIFASNVLQMRKWTGFQ